MLDRRGTADRRQQLAPARDLRVLARLLGIGDEWRSVPGVLPASEFRLIVEHECETADRYDCIFSLIILQPRDTATSEGTASDRVVSGILRRRLRSTDAVGLLNGRRVGVLLRHTPREGAYAVLAEFCAQHPDLIRHDAVSVSAFPQDFTTTGGGPQTPAHDSERLVHRHSPAWKRVLDSVGASLALALLSPIMLAAALVVRFTSDGPILFHQPRVGLGGRVFTFYKFRTMHVGADREKSRLRDHNERRGPVFKMRNDPRVTAAGRVLRRWSIDELPQLFCVLKGDMSLVGPRPLPLAEAAQTKNWHRRRLDVTPGITGLWQVNARDEPDFDRWVRLDIEYLRRRSLGLDLWILFRTVPAVLSGRGAH